MSSGNKEFEFEFDCLRDWVDVYISTKKLHCDIEYIVTAYKVGIINKVKWLFVLLEYKDIELIKKTVVFSTCMVI